MKRAPRHNPDARDMKRVAIEPEAIIEAPEPDIPPLTMSEKVYPRDVQKANALMSLNDKKHNVYLNVNGRKLPAKRHMLQKLKLKI